MRGKAVDTSFLEQYLRITPAYAGKSNLQYKHNCYLQGSPPPMRGKVPI